jgi:hypothetical protein
MKVLSLKIGEITYTTSRVTAYLARKAMEINKDSISLAKKGIEIKKQENVDLDEVESLMDQMEELYNLKSCFICQVYSEKFSDEELEKALTREQIEAEVKRIINAVFGVVEKNA